VQLDVAQSPTPDIPALLGPTQIVRTPYMPRVKW